MARNRKKPTKKGGKRKSKSFGASTFGFARVVNEPMTSPVFPRRYVNYVKRYADENRKNPTRAERHFEAYLLQVNNGGLKGWFVTQYYFSRRWILDFFFPENRLGIEIDGSIHRTYKQQIKDDDKAYDCKLHDITLLRLTNQEVFGDKNILVQKLYKAWLEAFERQKKSRAKVSRRKTRRYSQEKRPPVIPSETVSVAVTSESAPKIIRANKRRRQKILRDVASRKRPFLIMKKPPPFSELVESLAREIEAPEAIESKFEPAARKKRRTKRSKPNLSDPLFMDLVGLLVRHNRFGEGTIVRVESTKRLVVHFVKGGKKTVLKIDLEVVD